MSSLQLPTHHGPATLWIDGDVAELVKAMHEGDPTLGWEGDERLGIYRNDKGQWEIGRLGEDGQMYLILRSRPGAVLDRSVLVRLAEADQRRRNATTLEDIMDENDRLMAAREQHTVEAVTEASTKLYFALAKAGWDGE